MAGGWIGERCAGLRRWRVRLSAAGLLPLALSACAALEQPTADDVTAIAPAADAGVQPAATAAWPQAPSCAGVVRALDGLATGRGAGGQAAVAAGGVSDLDPMTAPLVVASLGPDPLPIRADLPIPEVTTTALGSAHCALLVGAAEPLPAAADVVLDQRTVHSAYPTGTKRRRNPEHKALERELAASKRNDTEGDVDILATGDPLLDLIGTVAGGIISGIGSVVGRSDIRAAETALADTPAFIEDPILTPYRYELTELEAERRLALPVALYDRSLGTTLETTVTLAERRRFAVLDGRHPKDVEPQHAADATPIDTAELAAWRRAKPPIATSLLVTHLAALEPGRATRQASLDATMAELGAPAAATLGAAAEPRTELARAGTNEAPAMPTELLVAIDSTPETAKPSAGPSARSGAGSNIEPSAGPAAAAAAGSGIEPASPVAEEARPGGAPAASDSVVRVGSAGEAGFYVTAEHIVVPASALGRSSLIAVRYPDGMRAHGMVELVDEALGLALVYLPRTGTALPLHPARRPPPTAKAETGLPWRDGETVIGLFAIDPETDGPRWIDSPTLDRFVGRLQSL